MRLRGTLNAVTSSPASSRPHPHWCPSEAVLMPKRRRVASADSSVDNAESAVGAAKEVEKGRGKFRWWNEERRFKGPGSVCVVQEALYAAGGVRTGGYPKAAPIPGPLGYQRPGDWDLLWSPARLALRAAPNLKPGQLISSSPGMMSLTRKRKLPNTLHTALGQAAWAVTPHSFVLPEGLPQLRAHMASRVAAGAGDELWILKTAQHLGKGLKIVPAKDLCAHAVHRHKSTDANGKMVQKSYVMAQRYVDNPLLVQGRKFGIRVWVLVLGPNPLRAYLHSNGLVLFATHGYDGSEWQSAGGDGVALGHVTNYAQNVDGTVWDLDKLKEHLGAEAFGLLWQRIATSAALMCSAAVHPLQSEHSALKLPPESAFELMGLDYLVDSALHPWLLEVNGTPSLAVDHSVKEVEQLIYTQKAGMVRDMFQLLGVSTRFDARYEVLKLAAKQAAARKKALAALSQQAQAGGGSGRSTPAAESDTAGELDDSEEEEDAVMDQDAPDGDGIVTNTTRSLSPAEETTTDEAAATTLAAGSTAAAGEEDAGDGAARQGAAGKRVRVGGGVRVGAGRSAGSSNGQTAGSGSGSGAVSKVQRTVSREVPPAAPLVLPRRLRDALSPRSDAAIRARVTQELQNRGAFQPLMELFPIPPSLLLPGPVAPPSTSAVPGPSGAAGVDMPGAVGVAHPAQEGTCSGVGVEPVLQVDGTSIQRQSSDAPGEDAGNNSGKMSPQPPPTLPLEDALKLAQHLGWVPWGPQDVALRRALTAAATQRDGPQPKP